MAVDLSKAGARILQAALEEAKPKGHGRVPGPIKAILAGAAVGTVARVVATRAVRNLRDRLRDSGGDEEYEETVATEPEAEEEEPEAEQSEPQSEEEEEPQAKEEPEPEAEESEPEAEEEEEPQAKEEPEPEEEWVAGSSGPAEQDR
jgi:outer membrane biosynthesis protein TonB